MKRPPTTGESEYLEKAIGRYSPDVAATARASLKKLRARFPGARHSFQVRSIRVDKSAAVLDEPYIRRLMAQALKVAGADPKSGNGRVVRSKISA